MMGNNMRFGPLHPDGDGGWACSLAPHPKSGLPDFGTKHVEIGYSRFRLQPKSGVPDFGRSNKRSKSETSDFDGEGRGEGLLSSAQSRGSAPLYVDFADSL